MFEDCSIIIPAFNSEKTIVSSLDSVELDESWKCTVEVIVVDDGSTDSTYSAAIEYSKSHPQVKVVSQNNMGVSAARNSGLDVARGKYIYFLDADDYCDRESLEVMIETAENVNTDLVVANYYLKDSRSGQIDNVLCDIPYYRFFDKEYINSTIYKRFFLGENNGLSNLCNKLFLKSIIDDNKLRFDLRRTHGEDWAFCISYFDKIESIYAIDTFVYTYMLDGSQSYSKYIKNLSYSIINGHCIEKSLNDKYLHFSRDSFEYLIFESKFYYQIIDYIKLDCNMSIKKDFLSNEEVKQTLDFLKKLDRDKLASAGFSMRDEFAFYALSYGIINPVITFIYK